MRPEKVMVFRPIGDAWQDPATGRVLADVLAAFNLVVDDKCVFARFKDYEAGLSIWYRAYSEAKISLTFWKLD